MSNQASEELVTELRRLLAIHAIGIEQANRLGLQPPEEVILGGFVKAILADRKKHELQARIDELNSLPHRSVTALTSSVDQSVTYERLDELKQELEKL